MIIFNKRKITDNLESVGEELKTKRGKLELSLESIALKLNIRASYLAALESGEIDKLPAGIYSRQFLKEYARFLGLDEKPLIEIYDAEIKKPQNNKQEELFSKKVPPASHFLAVPKLIKNSVIIILVLVFIVYLGFCVERIISPPKLVIQYPDNNITVNERSIEIRGITEKEAKVMINGESVLIDQNGKFLKIINLKNGLNTISISAQKKYSRENNVTRTIIVKT